MLSSVLKSATAADVGLVIVRTFGQLREMLSSHEELAARFEELERKISGHDQATAGLIDAIRRRMREPASTTRPINLTANLEGKRRK